MATYINPDAIKDHSVTSIKLADGLIVTDASIEALGYIKDVSNLATKSAAIGSLSLVLDSSDYKITLSGTKVDGTSFTVQNVIDLPLESVVVNGSYNNTTKKVVLTLQNGSSAEFSVADLVAGLQSEITSSNKLSADLIQDGTTNKTVTATEKSTWNGKQNAISDLDTIRANASAGAAKVSNVQADWDATTGLAVILNKPSNATYSTKGLVSIREHCGLTVNSGQLSVNTNGMISTGIDMDSIAYLLATSIDSYDNGDYGLKAVYDDNNLTCLTLTPAAANQIGGVKIGSGINVTSDGTISGFSGNYNDLSNKPDAVTESTVSGWGFTKNAAPGTLNTNNTTAQTVSASEDLSGVIKLHKIAKTGTYSDLIGTPAMTSDASVAAWGYTKNAGTLTGVKFNGTNATVTNGVASITATIPAEVTESTVSGWGFTKNTGTITGINMNGDSKGTSGVVNLGTVITEHAAHKLTATNNTASATTGEITFIESLTGTTTATSGDLTITATRKKITVPTAVTESTVIGWGFTKNAGTLTGVTFNNTAATVTDGVASITATIPSAPGTLNTTATTAQSTSSNEALSGNITLHKVAKTGTYNDLIDTPTIPTVNNATLTIQKNGTTVQTFTANASSNATANITVNELPTVTSSDNGKVLMVVNGVWSMVTPVSIYSGSSAPDNAQGINGDIYLQV